MGVRHVSEDAEILFVRVISSSKPVISNILNRVTRDSSSKKKEGPRESRPLLHVATCKSQEPSIRASGRLPTSQSERGGRDLLLFSSLCLNLIIKRALCKPCFHNSELLSPQSHCLSGAVLSLRSRMKVLLIKRCSTSDVNVNSGNPKRPKLSDGIPGDLPPPCLLPGISPTRRIRL